MTNFWISKDKIRSPRIEIPFSTLTGATQANPVLDYTAQRNLPLFTFKNTTNKQIRIYLTNPADESATADVAPKRNPK